MKTLIISSLLWALLPCLSFAQKIPDFKANSQGGKQERLETLEKYLGKVSNSINLISRKVSKSSGSDFNKLKMRVSKLERVKKNDNGCCSLVEKHNLPRLSEDSKAAKRRIKELETKTDKHKAEDFLALQTEVQLLRKSVDSLKKLVFEKLKAQQ